LGFGYLADPGAGGVEVPQIVGCRVGGREIDGLVGPKTETTSHREVVERTREGEVAVR
jgi:hypothetical protein